MTINELQKRALEIRVKYDELNSKRGVTWDKSAFMAGFVGDVGDLSKIIMAKEGLREMDDVDAKLTHEIMDCLWSVLVLAHEYSIDVPAAFMQIMDELDERIDKKIAN